MTNTPPSSDRPTAVRLRNDLNSSLHESNGEVHFVVEDPLNGSYFRMGEVEWAFARQLDGITTIQQAHERAIAMCGVDSLPKESVQRLVRWLADNGLTHGHRNSDRSTARCKPTASYLVSSAFFSRVPLLHPDGWLTSLHPWLGWCFSRWALLAWLALVVAGSNVLVSEASEFWNSASVYLSPSSWLVVFLIWFALKIVHELFHGLGCKHFGGNVGACGVALILFSPVAYVDVSSAWRFRKKWHRIVTSAAGLYIELAIAATAAIVWAHTTSPQTAFVCHAIVTTAGISSILFNANPLMRYDAYYVLSDWLDIPNLYGEGQMAVRSAMRTLLFGITTPTQTSLTRRRRLVLVYGFAAGFWRTTISVSLILAAARLFHGAGFVLSATAVVIWYGLPAVSFARFVVRGDYQNRPRPIRFLAALGVAVAMLFAIMMCPVPGGVRAPAIVEFEPMYDLRAESPGFVQAVTVQAGDNVTEGQTLVVLRNDDLAAELKLAATEVKLSEVRMRILRDQDRYAEYQAEVSRRDSAIQRRAILQQKSKGLIVAAPAAGVVISHRPLELLGKYVHAGESLVSIASESAKEIKVSIAEHHVESFIQHVGSAAQVYLNGQTCVVGPATLARVDPSATDALRQPLLGAHNGGPLPVRTLESDDAPDGQSIRLAAPRFQGVVRVPPDVASRLRAGQVGEVSFTDTSENLGRRAYRIVEKWLARRI